MATEPKYPNPPRGDQVRAYEEFLEEFLAHQGAKIIVKVADAPMVCKSHRLCGGRDELVSVEKYWIDGVFITTPEVKDLYVSLQREGIEEPIDRHSVWNDAYQVQNALYAHLGRRRGHPRDTDADPYWKLWDHLK